MKTDDSMETWFAEGHRQLAAGALEEAEACFRRVASCAPSPAAAWVNLGLVRERRGDPVEAEACYRRALEEDPELGEADLNLGALLTRQKRLAEAETACRRAVERLPASAAAWSNLGVLHACRKLERKAELNYRFAIDLDPDYSLAQFNLAYLLLRQGRYQEGWQRLDAGRSTARLAGIVDCPRWRGEALTGKRVLVVFEGGYGDMIQFARYAPLLKAKGAERVGFLCPPVLRALLATESSVDVAERFEHAVERDAWDLWVPSLSLPLLCATGAPSIPARIPYLSADPAKAARWAAEIAAPGTASGLRVGLAWRGNPAFENDADRSLSDVSVLAPLAEVPGVRWFSLQKTPADALPARFAAVDLAARIEDFSDAAAIVVHLDLVICVDTALAHLAGALGVPCWILLPDYKTDWRWLTEREDSPWYPGVVRLFRQPAMGDWSRVVDALVPALAARVAGG